MSESQPRKNGPAIEAGVPLVTVLIPVRNEQGFIGRCLRAIATQDYPHERIEVLRITTMSAEAFWAPAEVAVAACTAASARNVKADVMRRSSAAPCSARRTCI